MEPRSSGTEFRDRHNYLLSHFRMTETFGNRKRLGDKAFFAQCMEKIEKGESLGRTPGEKRIYPDGHLFRSFTVQDARIA